ncbi:carboxymuconolactone decarboxylase family protein [Sphingomonas montanisoli]|uniref:carboxymuconolactone decarboxylase family protein n=1 Tax=Sphingomonas montanisoli TaxID=2606412 RepID=UPI001C66B0E4|nr:carboxymuconolactone decarboxylase family protein [Sphingomonas montanisoli]
MKPRIANPIALAPEQVKAMMALESSFAATGLDPVLLELVRLRVSQMNHCAFCINMHTGLLRKDGQSEMRLYMLNAWRESSLYTPRERAALGWAETLTRLSETHAPDADYEDFAFEFSEAEQVQLTFAIGAINTWNRLQVGFRVAHPVSAEDRARVAA